FNISGPDYTADDYNKLLSTLSAGRIVIVLGTPASGAAVEKFAGKNRVVVAATRSGQEGNDIVFYDYFLEALQSPAADEDKNQKKELEQKIEALRINKDSLPAEQYDKEMESLLVGLALKNQEIRQQETKK